jgi:hypothetical protein
MELTVSQAIFITEAREVLRGADVPVDEMSDSDVLAYVLDAAQNMATALQKLVPYLEALQQMKRANENEDEFSPN